MLSVDSIEKGLVIDHIKAGKSMEIYKHMNMDELDCSIAILRNVKSRKLGKKDIIKVENRIDIDYNVLGYIDPNITVNTIENGQITKTRVRLPDTVTNVVHCKNPRCITSTEQELPHIFKLTDSEKNAYRCIYCEELCS